MKQTQNLGLKLPEGSDWADVTALNENMEVLDAAVAGKADVGEDGKIPASQLPEMNYDPAGSAAAVQANLTAHTGNTSNPHGVTAEQIGAIPKSGLPSPSDLNTVLTPGVYDVLYNSGVNQTTYHTPYGEAGSGYATVTHYNLFVLGPPTRLTQLAVSVYSHNRGYWWRTKHDSTWSPWYRLPDANHTHDTSQIVSGILPAARGGTGVGSIAALASLLAGQGLGKMTVGSYVGTGVMGPSNPNSITCAFPIKAVFMMRIGTLECGLGYFNKSGSWYYTSIIESMYTAQSGFQQNIGFGYDNSFTKRYAQFSSDRKTVSWYCVYDGGTDNPGAQFNEAGEIYEWIAIG